jgi:hypothetical protein
MAESKEKKQPTIKTLEDKGTKIDFADFGDGKQAILYQTEKFRGLQIGMFRLGWANKYDVISPKELTPATLTEISGDVSIATGSTVKPADFVVHSSKANLSSSFTISDKLDVKLTKKKE